MRRNLSGEPVLCQADADLLKQAFLNLFINATQAMEKGGELIVRSYIRDGQARVEIIDTGPGIAPEVQGRVFEAYFTTKSGGTGLGLATCRRIVEEHEGHIDLYSEVGKGSNFTVVLPLAQEQ